MKKFLIPALFVLCTGASITALAQKETTALFTTDHNKPELFQQFPEKILLNMNRINTLFSMAPGESVDMNIADGGSFRFAGQIVSVSTKYQNRITSVVIRSANFAGAILVVSKVTGEDSSVSYTGRIISRDNGDTYLLQEAQGRFTLNKKMARDLIID